MSSKLRESCDIDPILLSSIGNRKKLAYTSPPPMEKLDNSLKSTSRGSCANTIRVSNKPFWDFTFGAIEDEHHRKAIYRNMRILCNTWNDKLQSIIFEIVKDNQHNVSESKEREINNNLLRIAKIGQFTNSRKISKWSTSEIIIDLVNNKLCNYKNSSNLIGLFSMAFEDDKSTIKYLCQGLTSWIGSKGITIEFMRAKSIGQSSYKAVFLDPYYTM